MGATDGRYKLKTKLISYCGMLGTNEGYNKEFFPYILSLREPEFNIIYQHRTNIWQTMSPYGSTLLDGTNIN
jgi:hypothetical protein